MTLDDFPISPWAQIFPPRKEERFQLLKGHIELHGQLEPIIRHNGLIFDGVHRLRACIELGLEPWIEDREDIGDPLQFVLSRNRDWRGLEDDEKIILAFNISKFSRPGRPAKSGEENEANLPHFYTLQEACEMAGVKPRRLKQARRVLLDDGTAVEEVRQAALQGVVPFSDAAAIVGRRPEIQKEAVARRLTGKERTLRAAAERIDEEIREQTDADDARLMLSIPLSDRFSLVKSEVKTLRHDVDAGSVHAVIAYPPTDEKQLDVFPDLSAFADHALAPDGVMAVMVNSPFLLQAVDKLRHKNMQFITELDYRCPERLSRSAHPLRITIQRWPVLLFGKERFILQPGPDSITEPPSDEFAGPKSHERLLEAGMGLLVARLVRPGQTVCDPMALGRSGIALASLAHGCRFIGAAEDQRLIDRIWARVGQNEKAVQEAENASGDDGDKETFPEPAFQPTQGAGEVDVGPTAEPELPAPQKGPVGQSQE